jgi:hypothetical protein
MLLKCQFLAYKMNATNNMVELNNKVNSMAQQLEAIRAKVEKNDLVIILLCNLLKSYNLMVTLKLCGGDDLNIDFVVA